MVLSQHLKGNSVEENDAEHSCVYGTILAKHGAGVYALCCSIAAALTCIRCAISGLAPPGGWGAKIF